MKDKRQTNLVLDYQNYIETPPHTPQQMYGNACSNDSITINSWRDIWIKQMEANHKKLGSFKEYSLGKLFQCNKNKPAIIIGSGPSLAYNGEHLKENKDILTISCLHNFHYFVDRGIKIDYYVSLDAGPVVLEEIHEGGQNSPEFYHAATKENKLIAFIGSNPALFDLWQGEKYVFNAPIGDPKIEGALKNLENFNVWVSNGGNVLGAALYIAKAFMGSNVVAFMGADFSFGYNTGEGHKFHSWDSKYDKNMGHVEKACDVFGNKALTWRSYWNFKCFFDYVTLTVPGLYVNCTEGGIFGAYNEGNLMSLKQMSIKDFLGIHQMSDVISDQALNPEGAKRVLLY